MTKEYGVEDVENQGPADRLKRRLESEEGLSGWGLPTDGDLLVRSFLRVTR